MEGKPYKMAVGSLMYAMMDMRANLAFAVSTMSQSMSKASPFGLGKFCRCGICSRKNNIHYVRHSRMYSTCKESHTLFTHKTHQHTTSFHSRKIGRRRNIYFKYCPTEDKITDILTYKDRHQGLE